MWFRTAIQVLLAVALVVPDGRPVAGGAVAADQAGEVFLSLFPPRATATGTAIWGFTANTGWRRAPRWALSWATATRAKAAR